MWIAKHKLATRLWHWINALTIFVLLGSGLMILNAHPNLYWGQYGANFDQPWFKVAYVFEGGRVPGWLTIPSTYNLALARRWHLTFALVLGFGLLFFMVASLINRHFQRDLRLRRAELAPAHLAHDVREHLALRFHDPKAPGSFNTLQKLSYVGVIFLAIPLVIATGLTMSPGINAAAPWLLDLFGGRQSARSIHFIAAMALAAFIVVHLALVILAGPVNEVRSMITGRWRASAEDAA
ncbi:cytochrome b/b6 domain-containing protein [Sphingomonas yantingensis]|uniref:Ni/Fe-hydrogenase b-type cytochrome subunit n=1 Tax=Sphingomonas yantingensis TaxID=1241761 RepID=A0A7W9AMN4_9SPHN|nr:cytochrome b/b6 domain-containing protein [Sphingomonas yantingensis]MBB5697101.1 Ni/Fe-hydrogenase b-type cytochrome subunit [Sphingomonas yantingensis]